MPQAPVAPVAPKVECWFEYHPEGLREALKAGKRRPERIFSSTDPRWTEIEELSKKTPLYGNLVVGTVTRVGEDFVEGTLNLRVPGGAHLTLQRWDKAKDKMQSFETHGRWGSTQYADLMREAEDAKKQGKELNERTTKALESLASSLSKSGVGK